MKYCTKCGAQIEDNCTVCPICGNPVSSSFNAGTIYSDPFDHTAEFDAQDISDNKVISMLVYLLPVFGIIIALLAGTQSKYASFHVRQALKFVVAETLMWIVAVLTFFLVITPIAAGIAEAVLFVIKIICFFQICSGKAVEPYIIRNLKFMK